MGMETSMEFGFERLKMWQKSRILVKEVYRIVSLFCYDERHALSSQLRRAAVSVASNIAEGSGRFSTKEKIHFTEIAYESLMEVIYQIILAVDLGLAEEKDINNIRIISDELSRQLSAYWKSFLNSNSKL